MADPIAKIQLVSCFCDLLEEQTAQFDRLDIDPTKAVDGTRLTPNPTLVVRGFWIQNQSSQSLTAYVKYGPISTGTLNSAFELLPGADKFWGLEDEIERVSPIARRRFKPYNWRVQATGVMAVVVQLFP